MRTAVVLLLAIGALAVGCVASQAAGPRAVPATATAYPTPATSPPSAPTPAGMTGPVPSSPVPSPTDDSPAPSPTRISQVLATAQPPRAAPALYSTTLPMPQDTTVVWGGCASDGQCHWYNFYWAPTHEAVMQAGEPPVKVQHELCHAHQHWSIDGGAPLAPSDYDLHTWYHTAEGRSFTAAVEGLAWPWTNSAVNGLEDFAWTCSYWYQDPAHLAHVSPERYDWAAANLP